MTRLSVSPGAVLVAVAISCVLGASVGAQAVLQRGILKQAGFLAAGTGAVLRSAEEKMRDPSTVLDYGAKCDGSDEHAAIQRCITAEWECSLPGGLTCNAGNTTITVPSGHGFLGRGMRASTLKSTSSACGFSVDNNDGGYFYHLTVSMTGVVSTTRGVCITNVNGPTLRLSFEDAFIASDASPFVAGSYGVFIHSTTGSSNYYDDFRHLVTLNWDRGVESLGDIGSGGANANFFSAYSGNANGTGVFFDNLSGDNWVQGHCNASGTGFAQICAVLGDGTHNSNGNFLMGVTSDAGANGSVFKLPTPSANNFVLAVNESSGLDSFTGDSTNFVMTNHAVGASSRNVFLPNLIAGSTSNFSTGLFIGGAVRTVGAAVKANADYTLTQFDRNICSSGLTGAHTFTLSANTGQGVIICDSDGSITGTNTLTIAPPATGRVNGSTSGVVLNAAWKSASCDAPTTNGLVWSCRVSP